jgi:hypothetical protein
MNDNVIEDIRAAKHQQDKRWRGQILRDELSPRDPWKCHRIAPPDYIHKCYADAAKRGILTWTHILLAGVASAIDATGPETQAALRENLVQVAAMAAAWVECIDRRAAKE